MVKVKWIARSASEKGVIQPGTVMEWDSKEAVMLAKAGYVEILEEPKKKESPKKEKEE